MSQQTCNCGSGDIRYPIYDGYGIFLNYVCAKCEEDVVSKYRPDIFSNYECDEPIDESY